MTEPMNDDQLSALVADALADDRPPDDAVQAAYAAFGWRTLDADLAQLIEEAEAGALPQPEVVGFGHEPLPARRAGFTTDHGTIEVSIGQHRLTVTASPRPLRVVLRQPAVAIELVVDASGRAGASGLSGPARLEFTWPSGGSALTPWFTL
jgi:hypothetical protein